MNSERTVTPSITSAYLGDGQWHNFGPQPAPAIQAAGAPRSVPETPAKVMARIHNAAVSDGQWHHFGSQPGPTIQAASPKPKAAPQSQRSNPTAHLVAYDAPEAH
jgi:hypothetical protein